MGKRLSKTLASAGIASRRACEELIFDGRVKVNGTVVNKPQTLVDLETDRILVDNQPVRASEKKVYYILNKPFGTICSNKKMDRKRLVVDIFKDHPERLFTVGRLDRDTTGLLIVTNDGHFCNRVIHPSSNIVKEYLVKVNAEVSHEDLLCISKGGMVEGKFVKPVSVKKLRRGTIKIEVKEGKKREVRRFVEKAGLPILSLKRLRIGGLTLGNLEEGEYREMSERDKELLFESQMKYKKGPCAR